MRLNTFKKYFLTISFVFLLCFTFIVIILSVQINQYMANEKFESLNATCNFFCDFASSDYLSSGYRRDVFNISRAISNSNGDIVFLTDSIGTVISCSCEDYSITGSCTHSKKALDSITLDKIDSGKFNILSRMDGVFDEMHYISARAIKSFDGEKIGYVFAASTVVAQSAFYSDLFRLYALSAVIPIVVMFFVLYAMTYRWNRPLKMMSDAARAMAKGDFSRTIPVLGNDEIGDLCRSFNHMTESLRELENMRRGFIANVSHELKTPMTTIGGFVDGIVDGTIERDKQEHYLRLVSQEVRRLSHLVQSMLSLSKLEAGEIPVNPTNFNFRDLILDVVISQEQRINNRNLTIIGLDTITDCTVCGDRGLLHQVVYNLCDNAVKFTDEGGTVTFSLNRTDDLLDFRIRNTGPGIPKKDLPSVFERFYKGDKSRSANKDSTGLGLYLVKTIVKLHGGRVFVSSISDEYTEFGVALPTENFHHQ